MMINTRTMAVAVVAVFQWSGALNAQSPANIGTATAAFGTAVTQARDAEAVVWNPALMGIQSDPLIRDVPVGSFRVLGLQIGRAPSSRWMARANEIGLLGGGPAGGDRWSRWTAPIGAGAGGAGDLVWVASAANSFGVAVSTHARASGAIGDASTDTVTRVLSTVVTAGAAHDLVRGPQGSILRVGFSGKARWTHLHGRGAGGTAGSSEVFTEHVIRDVPGASFDLGGVYVPRNGVRIGAVFTDVVRLTWRPQHGPRRRAVVALPDGGLGEVYGPQADETDGSENVEAARRIYSATVPASWFRAGASAEGNLGVGAVAAEVRLRSGGLDAGVPARRLSASYELPVRVPLPLRLGVGVGTGGVAWSLGWLSPECRLPWTISVGQERTEDGKATLSISGSIGVRTRSACGSRIE